MVSMAAPDAGRVALPWSRDIGTLEWDADGVSARSAHTGLTDDPNDRRDVGAFGKTCASPDGKQA
ncbi:hypothetical protein GCM10009740_35300 [Terrabacter terrae]|uniref:Uncharacterized protein n=1 Tax=Terrabacter terrae TaxID=318434 RepID=A0ABP5G391_9MICO